MRKIGLLLLTLVSCTGSIGDPQKQNGTNNNGQQKFTPNSLVNRTELKCDPNAKDPIPQHKMIRVTREEYNNAISDLFPWVTTKPEFAADEKIAGFANNKEGLSTDSSIRLFDKAAEKVAAEIATQPDKLFAPCTIASKGEDGCVQDFLSTKASRIYRRPLTADEIDLYFNKLYKPLKAAQGSTPAITAVLEVLLQSPNFLYLVEQGTPDASLGAGVSRLSSYEVGGRLAHFLWHSLPDDALLSAAQKNELQTKSQIEAQARRMIADARAKPMIHSFYEQLLRINKLETISKDATLFPEFNDQLRASMLNETRAFLDYVVWQGKGSFQTVLTAKFSYIDPNLATLYGLPKPAQSTATFTELAPETNRGGILTHASFLTSTSTANNTSVVQRGLAVRSALFCEELPPPPPGAQSQTETNRLVTQPCASCHTKMDPIGFGLENYNAIGKYRTEDKGKAIDSQGQLSGIHVDNPAFTGAVELGQRIAASSQHQECLTTQWYRFSNARQEVPDDACVLKKLDEALLSKSGDLRELIIAMTTLDEFRLQRIEAAEACQ